MAVITNEIIEKRVRLSRKWGVILGLLLGAVTAVVRVGQYSEATEMLAEGVSAQATVMEKRHWIEEGRRGRQHDRYGLTYEFSDSAGTAHTKEINTNEEFYMQVSEGGPLDIIYRSSDPAVNDTRAHYERNTSIEMHVKDILLIMAIFIAGGYVIGFLVNNKMKKMLSAQT
ncbi:MAG TPA: hypothetical protein VFX02_07715 [Gammaproteobacteria bacterium]|nr:hypothetical protein [Gammaproteobacteria bacterium]